MLDRVILRGVRGHNARGLRVASRHDPIRQGEYLVVTREQSGNITTLHAAHTATSLLTGSDDGKATPVESTVQFTGRFFQETRNVPKL